MGKQRSRFQGKYQSVIFFLGLFFGVTLSLVGPGVKAVKAETLMVTPEGPLRSIQEAIAKAQPGDLIQVVPGLYQGPIVIDKSIKLIGEQYPQIDGGGNGDTITIKADGVTVQGFEIRGSGRKLENSDAGIKIFSSGNIIKDNHLTNNLFGIYLNKSSKNILTGNIIQGRSVRQTINDCQKQNYAQVEYDALAELRPTFEGEGGDGIFLFASPDNQVINNTIKNTRDGIYFNYADNNALIGNRISNVRYGIHYMYSNDNTFESNVLTENVAGAALMFSKNIRFKNNIFAHSRGQRSYGLLFSTCDDSLAEGNLIIDNTRGAFLDVSLHNVFRNNFIASNDVGIDLISSSSDNLFVNNNLVDNLQQVAMIAGQVGEGNRFFENGKGNYWSDYRGFDLDRNGTGDIPYLSGDPFTYLMKKAPAVRLFLNSPAASALEFSERMFPILNIPKVKDPYPYVEPLPLQVPDMVDKLTPRSTNKELAFYSLAMLLVSGFVFFRVFKISSRTTTGRDKKGRLIVWNEWGK